MSVLTWETALGPERGAVERAFTVEHGEERLPGVAWLPHVGAPRGLIVIGHGFTVDKRNAFHVPIARALASRHGLAAAAIDMPCHGDRRHDRAASPEDVARDYLAYWRAHDGGADIAAELRATTAALRAQPEVGEVPVGYYGLSLGTQYGVFHLAEDPTVRAAVLGLYGLVGPRVAKAAARVGCPVFFVRQLGDELHAAESALALFETLGSADKTLRDGPGAHEAVSAEIIEDALSFLAERVSPPA